MNVVLQNPPKPFENKPGDTKGDVIGGLFSGTIYIRPGMSPDETLDALNMELSHAVHLSADPAGTIAQTKQNGRCSGHVDDGTCNNEEMRARADEKKEDQEEGNKFYDPYPPNSGAPGAPSMVILFRPSPVVSMTHSLSS